MMKFKYMVSFSLVVLTMVFVSFEAQATVAPRPLSNAELTKQECSACHYYYKREFLPAYSWKEIIDNLSNHFGEDASLDAETRTRILTYMEAGRSDRVPMRITKTNWWKQIHGSPQFSAYLLQKNIHASNCGSCHR